MNKPARNLERVYATYNRKFFDSALPLDTQIYWNDEVEDEFGSAYGYEEDNKHRFFNIYINPKLHVTDEQRRLTLLHEMIHVKLFPYAKHGRKFEEEKMRLVMRGALKDLW